MENTGHGASTLELDMNKYYLKTPFMPARPSRVLVKDEEGKPCGEYDAYYRPEKGTAILYPAPGSWIYGRLVKQEISIRYLIKSY